MESQHEHFRQILLYYFRKEKNAVQACEKLRKVYGDKTLKERQCQYWFARFCSGYSVKDAPRSGRPLQVDNEKVKVLIETNRHSIIRHELAEALKVSNIAEKRPDLINRKGVVFHHARPHTSLMNRQKLLELGWDVLPHPLYSPDLAPSDYYLFRSLQNSLNERTFALDDAIERHLVQVFDNKDNKKFFEDGIRSLSKNDRRLSNKTDNTSLINVNSLNKINGLENYRKKRNDFLNNQYIFD